MLPQTIIDKAAVARRKTVLIMAVMAGLFSYGAFSAGETGLGVLAGLAVGALLSVASKIKVKRHYQGGVGHYR